MKTQRHPGRRAATSDWQRSSLEYTAKRLPARPAWSGTLLITILVTLLLGCGRYRFETVGDGSLDQDIATDGAQDQGGLERPTLVDVEDELFWDNGGGNGEHVVATGTGFIDGVTTIYISTDDTLDAGDIAQDTTFVTDTTLRFIVNIGGLGQGAFFVFATNDTDVTTVDADLTSDPIAVSVGRMWTPADASGVAGWWDAADPGTIVADAGAGNRVLTWGDKSGRGNDFISEDGSSPVTGAATLGSTGLNALVLDGNDELIVSPNPTLDLDASGGVNIFAVFNYDGFVDRGSGLNVIFCKNNAATASTAYAIAMSGTNAVSFKSGQNTSASAGVLAGQDLVFAGVSNSAGPRTAVFVNGALVTENATKGPSNNGAALRLGDDIATTVDRHAAFTAGEFILVGGNLSADVVALFEGYLAHKWGIPLDSGHPFAAKFTEVVFD